MVPAALTEMNASTDTAMLPRDVVAALRVSDALIVGLFGIIHDHPWLL